MIMGCCSGWFGGELGQCAFEKVYERTERFHCQYTLKEAKIPWRITAGPSAMGRVNKPVKARPAMNARAKAKAEPRAEPQRIQVICKRSYVAEKFSRTKLWEEYKRVADYAQGATASSTRLCVKSILKEVVAFPGPAFSGSS